MVSGRWVDPALPGGHYLRQKIAISPPGGDTTNEGPREVKAFQKDNVGPKLNPHSDGT